MIRFDKLKLNELYICKQYKTISVLELISIDMNTPYFAILTLVDPNNRKSKKIIGVYTDSGIKELSKPKKDFEEKLNKIKDLEKQIIEIKKTL